MKNVEIKSTLFWISSLSGKLQTRSTWKSHIFSYFVCTTVRCETCSQFVVRLSCSIRNALLQMPILLLSSAFELKVLQNYVNLTNWLMCKATESSQTPMNFVPGTRGSKSFVLSTHQNFHRYARTKRLILAIFLSVSDLSCVYNGNIVDQLSQFSI